MVPPRVAGARRTWLTRLLAIPLFLVLTSGVAWAYWTATSVPGGAGAAAATKINPGATPTAVVAGSSVTVSWAATTLATGTAVSGYQIKRYDAGTGAVQTIRSACAWTISATSCIESGVPAGSWKYTVTPRFATNWQGQERTKSSAVTVTVALTLPSTPVRLPKAFAGTAAGFITGETLVYLLDDPVIGKVLTGKLAGITTPAAVPAGGGGVVSVTVPVGTSDGAHTVYAVTSPSGQTAAAAIMVDVTKPAAPTITSGASGTTGPDVWISFTGEAGAAFACTLDSDYVDGCTSPMFYSALTNGPHTFSISAKDVVGNVSPDTNRTWTVDPAWLIDITSPAYGRSYNDSTYDAGCSTPVGDLCGTVSHAGNTISTVKIAVLRNSTGLYLTGTGFDSGSQSWTTATGTTSWNYPLAAGIFPTDDTYTLLLRATDDVGNVNPATTTMATQFRIDRTAPLAPTITSGPSGTTSPDVSAAFTAEAGATFECRLEAGTWAPCASPQSYSTLANGSHTFEVRAVDLAGNTGPATSRTWTVDAAWLIDITSPNNARSYNDSAYDAGCSTPAGDLCGTASHAGNAISTVQIAVRRNSTGLYLTGGTFSAPGTNWITATGTTSWRYALDAATFEADGTYTLTVRATDAVGNVNTADTAFDIDRTGPAATITSGASGTTSPGVTISFTGEAGATFACRIDATTWTACMSPRAYGGLPDGSHIFEVRATDLTGNTGPTTSRTWTVDATWLTIGTTFPAYGPYGNTTYDAGCGTPGTGDVCGTASDAVKVEIAVRQNSSMSWLTGGTFSSASQVWTAATGTAPWSHALDAATLAEDGTYEMVVRATDAAGNVNTASTSFLIDTTAPTVSGVSSPLADGSYKVGQVVPVAITFSEPVTVTGTPQLTLSTGTPATTAVDYTSGSGTAVLTFNYTVAAGNTSVDLAYASTAALALNSGTIRDAATNDATLGLATPGAANSLSANKALVIDTTAPTVSGVSSPLADGSYKAGQVVPVTITFSEPVTVTGIPQLTLSTGSPPTTLVNYAPDIPSTVLTFNYTVAAGNTSADLAYASTAALGLNSGTIRDAATNNATLGLATPGAASSLSANKALVIDTTAPTVSGVSSPLADGSYPVGQVVPVAVTFSEPVTVTGTPQLTLSTGTPATTAVDYTSGSGSTVLTFNYTVAAGNTSADLSYQATTSLGLNSGTIRDLAANDATLTLAAPGAASSLSANKALVIDTAPPAVTVTKVSGSVQAFPYFTNANVTSIGGTCGTATGDSATVTPLIAGVATSPATTTCTAGSWSLTLTTPLSSDGSRTLSATQPDAAGNTGTASLQTVTIDKTLPTVSGVSSPLANGSYTAGQVIPVTITFTEPVTVTGTPQLTLNTGTPATTAVDYTSGSGSTVLTFNYTVVAGNNSADLRYAATTSLGLNSGTIRDLAANNATLTLASPGAANSLNFNKALVITP